MATELGPLAAADGLNIDESLELMVRPDDLVVEADPSGAAEITTRSFQGMFYQYAVALPSGNTVRCLVNHARRYDIGAPVTVHLRQGDPYMVFAGEKSIGTATASIR